jgi:hypothetical protein
MRGGLRVSGDLDSHGVEHRVFYVATFVEAVYVLHAFEKRTRKTLKHDLELAQNRLRALVNRRRTDAGKTYAESDAVQRECVSTSASRRKRPSSSSSERIS